MSSPFLRSLVRFPVTTVSTVTMSTRYPAPAARSTRSLFIPLSRWMYSWNHRSGWAAPARSSIVVVAIVDNAYGSPCRCAARPAAISPPGCNIRVYPVGASASGSGRSRSSSRAEVSTVVISGSARGWNRQRRNAAMLAAVDVVEDRPRDQPAPHGAQVIDVVACPQPPARRVKLDWLHPDQLTYLRRPHVRD